MIRIALDVMGGDNCPGAAVEGAVRAAAANQDIAITLVGKEQAIKDELAKLNVNSDRITILPTTSLKKLNLIYLFPFKSFDRYRINYNSP